MRKHTTRSLRFAAIAILASALAWAHAAPPTQPDKGASPASIRVTYLVYSGRPNPSVTLAPGADFERIAVRLQYAQTTGARVAPAATHPVLGYNGVLIERFDNGALTSSVVVKNYRMDDRGTVTSSASAGDLESAALEIGRTRGVLSAQVIDVIGQSSRR